MTQEQEQAYVDSLPIIDQQLIKNRDLWKLSSLASMDYNDVSQIIRLHIYKQWGKYDPDKPLVPWANTVIKHQIQNIVRNNYTNYARPCLKCAASLPDDGCAIPQYETQCNSCPIYARWEARKKNAMNIKLPVSLEFHSHETQESPQTSNENLPQIVESLHEKMKEELTPIQWRVYEALYIKGEEELEVARQLGYKTTERNRSPGYKQIKNIQKVILLKAKKCIYNGELELL